MTTELPGSEFLVAVAGVAMAFSAFSSISLSIRAVAGGPLSPFHSLLIRYTVECGLLAAGFALVPVLLALTPLPLEILIRISCAALAFVVLIYALTYIFIRRRRVMSGPLPLRFLVLGSITVVVDLCLWLQAFGALFDAAVWPYAFADLWVLTQAGIVFILTFDMFLKPSS